jgi:hypothetical protein
MKKDDLQNGWIPLEPDGKKRGGLNWKTILGLVVFLVTSYTVKSIRDNNAAKTLNKAVNEAVNTVNTAGPGVVSYFGNLSLQEQEHILSVRDKAQAITRKYLSPDEYAQALAIGLKGTNGTVTSDEIYLTDSLTQKVRSLASASEKEVLDEMVRLIQKLMQK